MPFFGFNDVPFGTFVDQKWIDLVPAFFDKVCILKHPGCNIAYWNLHERTLSQGKDAILVNNQPLCFFHFSGVKASKPDVLSSIKLGTRLNEDPFWKHWCPITARICSDLNTNPSQK
jgi:hypothetical protein